MTEITHPLLRGPGRLYAGGRPERPFDQSAAGLAARGITTIACLLEVRQFPDDLRDAYRGSGLDLIWFPIPDFGVPENPAGFSLFLGELHGRLGRGERLYLHCLGGIGRTGMTLACMLKALGVTGDPVHLVRSIYSPLAVESEIQRRFVKAFGRSR